MHYPVESFTSAEQARLEPHFTNLDRPVFGLVDLPETVKGVCLRALLTLSGDAAALVPG